MTARVWLFPVPHLFATPTTRQFVVPCVSRPRSTPGTESGTNFGLIQVSILRASSDATGKKPGGPGQAAPPLTPVLTCFRGASSLGRRGLHQVGALGGGDQGLSRASDCNVLHPPALTPVARTFHKRLLGSHASVPAKSGQRPLWSCGSRLCTIPGTRPPGRYGPRWPCSPGPGALPPPAAASSPGPSSVRAEMGPGCSTDRARSPVHPVPYMQDTLLGGRHPDFALEDLTGKEGQSLGISH